LRRASSGQSGRTLDSGVERALSWYVEPRGIRYQAFQWAVAYPDFIDAIVPVNTAPWTSVNTDKQLAELQARLASDPELHSGRYYGKAACRTVLTDIRVETLKSYGIDAALAPRFPDPAAPEAAIRDQATNSAARWDANSQIILRRALLGFDTRPGFREDQSQGALRPVPHRRAVSTNDRARCHQGLDRSGGRVALFRARQRSRPFLQWSRARQTSPVLREFLAPLVARLN